jgi:hypothetical protein
MFARLLASAVLFSLLSLGAAAQQSSSWATYVDPDYGFSAELPYGQFEALSSDGSQGLTLGEVGGNGQISIYGGDARGLTLEGFAERLTGGNEVRNITYQAEGNSWFVLSGFYQPETGTDPLIFYTKVLLSADHERFSAFEISYDADEKARYDAIVERLENNFTRPPTS